MGRKAISVEQIIKRDGFRCHYCALPMNVYHAPSKMQQRDPKRFTFEHIVPRSIGGTFGLYNIVGACAGCNSKHGNDHYKCFCGFCQAARVRFELKEMGIAS
jgi:5-methylcytosine-specific restriction endonuclease McrA